MKRTSPSSRFESIDAISAGFSNVGPLVVLMLTFNSFAMIYASVVFPSPGGP